MGVATVRVARFRTGSGWYLHKIEAGMQIELPLFVTGIGRSGKKLEM